jgi:uncharacterized protein (TIGR02996 family)
MNEREAFLKAICENPDDDTPRLVFADWLQENGNEHDRARAEFIRLQVQFAALLRGAAPGAEEVRKQERAIWAEHKETFRAELPEIGGVAWFPEFHRGFVERCTISSDSQFLQQADAIFTQVPIQHIEIGKFTACKGFESLTHLKRLKSLRLINRRASEAMIRRLMTCDQFNDAMILDLHLGEAGRTFNGQLRKKFGSRII